MHKGRYQVRPGLTIEVEAGTQVELFEELAGVAEVFGEPCCGLCHETAIVPIYRHVGKLEFAEWACPSCGARLSFGNTMEGGRLFPIRALTAEGKPDREHGTRGEPNGWTKYRGPNRDAGSEGPQTPVPRKAPLGDGTLYITREQWEQIKMELRKHLIGHKAFLDRFGCRQPRELLACDFPAYLAMARKPDDRLRALQVRQGDPS